MNYNFQISFEVDFPTDWLRPPINAVGKPVDEKFYNKCFYLALQFMELFELRLIKYLKTIYFLDYMKFYDKEGWGGTRTKDSIYVTMKSKFSDFDVLRELTEEFNSVLFLNIPFPEQEWRECLPKGFSYTGTGVEMLSQPDLLKEDEELQKLGFINKYAASSLENDYNQLFIYLYLKEDNLRLACAKNELIQKKVNRIKQYLKSVS